MEEAVFIDETNPCERFPYGSRLREICEGRSELSIEKANKLRGLYGIDPLAIDTETAISPRSHSAGVGVTVHLKGNTNLTQRGSGCSSCGKKAKKPSPIVTQKEKPLMPKPGPKKGFSVIERVKKFTDSLARHIADDSSAALLDDVVFRKSKCDSCYFNIKDECGLCGCPLSKNMLNNGKISWRSESCPAGRWFRQSGSKRPLVNPKRNLVFHIYPKKGAEWNWKWHIKTICENADLFNGKICIGVNIGTETASIAEVESLFRGIHVSDWVVKKNSKLAETLTFTELMACVQTDDPNSVTLRGHTKGVTHSKADVSQKWKELMWQACLDWPSVNDALSSHLAAGPMKCHEPLTSTQPYKWFYAGSFWWQRDREVFQRNWQETQNNRWFSEYFPGLIFKNEETACLLHDFTKGSVLSHEYWQAVVDPEWKEWKLARGISDPDIHQRV